VGVGVRRRRMRDQQGTQTEEKKKKVYIKKGPPSLANRLKGAQPLDTAATFPVSNEKITCPNFKTQKGCHTALMKERKSQRQKGQNGVESLTTAPSCKRKSKRGHRSTVTFRKSLCGTCMFDGGGGDKYERKQNEQHQNRS